MLIYCHKIGLARTKQVIIVFGDKLFKISITTNYALPLIPIEKYKFFLVSLDRGLAEFQVPLFGD
jgi:hypothetical protein